MLFHTPLFLLFFSVFFLLYSFVFLRRTPRLWLILIGRLVFYAGWNYRFIPLLILSAVVDYAVGLALDREEREPRRKWLLSASIVTNLGILATFKYANFAMESASTFAQALGYSVSAPVWDVVLPVGISFYTFQSMSYTIDVYRRQIPTRRGLLQFTAALSFFPQLVAGPILRARQILPQLERMPRPTWEGTKHGLVLITAGLVKKTLADLLAAPVARAFDAAEPVSLIETWTGVLAFAGQIYGDFSGYSDIAIGLGLLLGFQIPANFRLPYFASSPVDFWRRWHITLSTWLRDYVYISFGGNRAHLYRNLMITMLLGGLWHGASWTFIVWGAYHGILVVVQRLLERIPTVADWSANSNWWARLTKTLLTLYLVFIGWVFFRAQTLSGALAMLGL